VLQSQATYRASLWAHGVRKLRLRIWLPVTGGSLRLPYRSLFSLRTGRKTQERAHPPTYSWRKRSQPGWRRRARNTRACFSAAIGRSDRAPDAGAAELPGRFRDEYRSVCGPFTVAKFANEQAQEVSSRWDSLRAGPFKSASRFFHDWLARLSSGEGSWACSICPRL